MPCLCLRGMKKPGTDTHAATMAVRQWGKRAVIYVVTFSDGDTFATTDLSLALKAVRKAACSVAGAIKYKQGA